MEEYEEFLKIDPETEELKTLSKPQRVYRDQLVRKQEEYYKRYLSRLNRDSTTRNTLIDTLMDPKENNFVHKKLSLLCTQYDVVPTKESAFLNYSDSIATIN